MNRKGFTLVEVAISVSLLSLVMIFMIKIVTNIRNDEDFVNVDTDNLINKSIISKTINEDIRNSNGINSLTCTSIKCNINLNDSTSRELIVENNSLLVYKDITKDKILFSRKTPGDYNINLNSSDTNYLFVINIDVLSHPEYSIEIAYKR